MKWCFVFCLLMWVRIASAQVHDPVVIVPQGGSVTADGYNLSWTIGDLATETAFRSSAIYTQGFQQPRLVVHPAESGNDSGAPNAEVLSDVPDIFVYPNPFGTHLCFDIGHLDDDYIIEVSDLHGRQLLRVKGHGPVEPLVLQDLPAATYNVRFIIPAIDHARAFRVIKSY